MIPSYFYRGFTLSESVLKYKYYIYYLETKITDIPMTFEMCITYIDKNIKRLKPIKQSVQDMKNNKRR